MPPNYGREVPKRLEGLTKVSTSQTSQENQISKSDMATIDIEPPPVDLVFKVVRESMEALNQLDGAAGDFILPLSPTSGGGFCDQDDQHKLTPEPDVGDLLSASFFMEPRVSQVQSSAADEEMILDVGGFEAVVQGLFADASVPSPLLLNQGVLVVEVQVSEEENKG